MAQLPEGLQLVCLQYSLLFEWASEEAQTLYMAVSLDWRRLKCTLHGKRKYAVAFCKKNVKLVNQRSDKTAYRMQCSHQKWADKRQLGVSELQMLSQYVVNMLGKDEITEWKRHLERQSRKGLTFKRPVIPPQKSVNCEN